MSRLDLGEMSRMKSRGLLLMILLIVAAVGLLFDWLLVREGVSRFEMMIVSNTLTGIVAAGLFSQIIQRERERRALLRQRLQVIAEMNHHIRNALQVISFSAAQERDQKTVEMVRGSVDRIQWALREILPAGTDFPKTPSNSANLQRLM
jgi:hypothetical protein